MAEMIPSIIGDDGYKSVPKGEQEVFYQLKNHTPDSWVALHSLRLKKHEFKKSGEADFVLITDKGVLIIEVKGGENFRDDAGLWIQTKKGYKDRISTEGPFNQAMGAYFAIEKYLKEANKKELLNRLPWGWGVIMPHCIPVLPDDDPEIDSEMLLDQKHFPEGLEIWAVNLVEYWRKDTNQKKLKKISRGHCLQNGLPPSTRDQLKELLRPRFECHTGLGQVTREAEQHQVYLTEKQYKNLIAVRSKSTPRAIIEGAAGTGKTLLAFEFAKECAQKGERVLLVCFNVNLARMLKSKAKEIPAMANVIIDNYHQLVKYIRSRAGLATDFSSNWKEFNERCFDLVAEALDQLNGVPLFDRIIMDEGQDLMSQAFLDVLDLLLEGGLTPPANDFRLGGKWLVAMDRAQVLYDNNFDNQALERLERCCGTTLELEENCRNTRPVAMYVYGFSKAGSCKVLTVEGPTPVIDYFTNQESLVKLLRQYINETLREYEKIGKQACDIAILSARKALIPDALFEAGTLNSSLERFCDAKSTNIVWETIHGFKGLEASTVILIGVEELENDKIRQLMYVGGSRARTRLIWLLPDGCSDVVQTGLLEMQNQFSDANMKDD